MGTHYTWKCIIHGKCSSHRQNIQCPKGKNLQSQTALLSFSAKKGKKLAWQPCSWRPHFLRAPGGHSPLKCYLQGGTRSDGTGWVIASPGNKSNDPSPIPLIGKLPLPFLFPFHLYNTLQKSLRNIFCDVWRGWWGEWLEQSPEGHMVFRYVWMQTHKEETSETIVLQGFVIFWNKMENSHWGQGL